MPSLMERQLQEACQLTGAKWAAWLERNPPGWNFCATYRLTAPKRLALLNYLSKPSVYTWLSGALTGSRPRWRLIGKEASLDCRKVYVFAEPIAQRLILTGVEELDSSGQRIWQLVARCEAVRSSLLLQNLPENIPLISVVLPHSLRNLLEAVYQTMQAQGGWLATRSGEILEVKAQINCLDCDSWQIPLESSPLLEQIRQRRAGIQIRRGEVEWPLVPPAGIQSTTQVWAAIPITIGQRLIGVLALWREKPFSHQEWQRMNQLATHIAPEVEESILFSNIAEHLSRLAMLNDFALTVSSALNLEQVAQRVFALLRRAFNTDWISLFLFSSNNSTISHYRHHDGQVVLHTFPWQNIPILQSLENGNLLRVDDFVISPYQPVYEGARSALFIPLRYRQQLIGALGLEKLQPDAFTLHDEHLLVVIASHLAGLVENGRLRQEAEARARNLELIHEVVQQIIGLTDVRQVTQIAARLLARNFAYELTTVMLPKDGGEELEILGIGGEASSIIQEGVTILSQSPQEGIAHRVFVTGQSMLVNDVGQDILYSPLAGWQAGSEMCVPLREGEQILGVIDVQSRRKNAFMPNDLLLLESLAGVLATVIARVGEYQKLQAAVSQLQAARQELQERIASQRMTETRLIQAAKMAAVGEMAAGIAHELNNPLTTVSGFAELVLEELPPDSAQRADLELILREAKRARDVVRRLLDFARQSEAVRVHSDINEIIHETLALMSHLLHTSGVEVVRDLADSLPWIPVDRNQIKQVLLNLFHNALHAMPTGGKLIIRTESRRQNRRLWITIAIQDTGIGIAPENLPRVFEPFFTTRTDEGGTGLGLSISYGIIVDHGGTIGVESEVGKGSCFTIWLPSERIEG